MRSRRKSKVNRNPVTKPNDDRNQFNPITTESLQQLSDFSHLSSEQCIKARTPFYGASTKCEQVETEFQILELEFICRKLDAIPVYPWRRGTENQWAVVSIVEHCPRGI